jgi:hypothetical protein
MRNLSDSPMKKLLLMSIPAVGSSPELRVIITPDESSRLNGMDNPVSLFRERGNEHSSCGKTEDAGVFLSSLTVSERQNSNTLYHL